MAPLVRTGGSRHTGLAALPHRNIHQKKCNKANEKIQDLNLTPQQWDAVDAAITAENISSIEYIRIAYKQGIIDAFSFLRETI